MRPNNRPSITQDLVDRLAKYHAKNPAWGSLHTILDEPNYCDGSVRHCIQWAEANNDTEGKALAEILMTMSKTQRSKIGPMAEHRWQELGLGYQS